MAYTEEELAGLTDDERAALEEEDGTNPDEHDEADDEAEGDQDEGGADSAEDTDADEPAANAGAADGNDEAEPEPDRVSQKGPILVSEAPENAAARLQEIAESKSALRKQYDEGEITFDEYEGKVDTLDEERMDIRLAQKEAETASKIEYQRQENEKQATITTFLNDVGIKRSDEDPQFVALNKAVMVVASIPDNQDKSAAEILQEAYELCVFRKQITPKAKPEAKADQVKPARKPLATVPTLARVPAADQTSTDEGNRFAHLDRLNTIEREKAFAKMSQADQDAYLAS